MQSRLLRSAMLASLSALAACTQDPKTHAEFNVTATGGGGSGVDAAGVDATSLDATMTMNGDAMAADGGTNGCGLPPDPGQLVGQYSEYHLSISGPDLDANNKPKVRDRRYYVRLPKTYDATKPYPVVYLGPGCNSSTAGSVLGLTMASKEEAILVAIMPLIEFGQCFDERVSSAEYPFFDALHKQIEATLCVDGARQFYAGFSTGARLGNMFGCVFPGVLRAYATIQGVLPPLPACTDHPIANLTLADTLEVGNPYQANITASKHVLAANKCANPSAEPSTPPPVTAKYDPGTTAACSGNGAPPSCVTYTGCPAENPVVFCTTTSGSHSTCEPWADFAFWNFFKQF
jgi:poly(3-hydroxybutyrate) depolymerase